MNFEDKIKSKLKKDLIERVFQRVQSIMQEYEINNDSRTLSDWERLLNASANLIWEYIEKYTQLTYEEGKIKIEEFFERVSNKNLNEMKKDIQLTPEEWLYLLYNSGVIFYTGQRTVEPISEILLRRKLMGFISELVGKKDIIEMLDYDALKKSAWGQQTKILRIVTGEIFVTGKQVDEKINERIEKDFNQRINCGGYALELDTCVFNHSDDFEKSVSELLDKVPFIRLLGDKKLGDDEYLVLWRVHEGGGHHFVKIQDDGTIIEKDGCEPIKIFSGWSKNMKDCPEAVFAAKKEHDMWLQKESFSSICIDGKEGKNFEETAQQAVRNQNNSFEYHNHSYYLKQDEDGNVYICSEGRIIADALIENGDCLVDVKAGEERYVSNTQPSVPLQIKDGKLQNNDDNESR